MLKIRRLFSIIIGDDNMNIEHRLFNILVLLLSIMGILGAYQNYLLKMNALSIYSSLIGGIIAMVLFYIARIRGHFRDSFVYFLVAFAVIIISIVFFNNSGSSGPIILLQLCLFNIIFLISSKKNQPVILVILLLNVATLYYIEYRNDELIISYNSKEERFWDLLFTFSNATIFMYMSLSIFKRSYNNERKKIEEQNIKLNSLNKQIQEKNTALSTKSNELEISVKEVQEKNVLINSLIKEINHRVKNNLQLVTSLLSIQEMKMQNGKAKDSIKIAKNRILAIGLIHNKLNPEKLDFEINIIDYIDEFCDNLIKPYEPFVQTELNLNPKELKISIEIAVHIGLIINELITNSLKYAWTDDKNEKIIKIKTAVSNNNTFLIEVSDNGIGFKNNFKLIESESNGLNIVSSIVDYYDGVLEFMNEDGAYVKIKMVLN